MGQVHGDLARKGRGRLARAFRDHRPRPPTLKARDMALIEELAHERFGHADGKLRLRKPLVAGLDLHTYAISCAARTISDLFLVNYYMSTADIPLLPRTIPFQQIVLNR
jgi:hypothetical protein